MIEVRPHVLFVQALPQQFVPVSLAHLSDVAILVQLILRDAWYVTHVAIPLVAIDETHVFLRPTLLHCQLALKHLLQGVAVDTLLWIPSVYFRQ